MSLLSAAVTWIVVVTAVTEGLSLLGLLSFGWVLTAWLVFVVLLTVSRLPNSLKPPGRLSVGSSIPGSWWLAMIGLAAIVLAIGLTAVFAAPNTWDSLTYHMPRVAHWIQNRSVAHYPTHIPRQIHLAPLAEFTIMQFQILTGGDRLANLVQWLAMLGSLVGVSLIARELGGDPRCQILASIVCGTIPMGILQASGTQNDYVVSFWLVSFVYYACAITSGGRADGGVADGWWLGASLGSAILTKATAYIVVLPFLVWLILNHVRNRNRFAGKAMAVAAVVVLALNAGHYWRNSRVYGSPLGPGREGPFVYANETFSAPALISNLVRNAALHVGTPDERINAVLEGMVQWLHDKLGADIDDGRTTWLGTTFHVVGLRVHEDLAGNLAHAMLVALSCVLLVTVRTLRRRFDLLAYAGALVVGFAIFSLYLRWQPWHSRLQLPLFVLWSPIIAVACGQIRRLPGILVFVLLLLSVPWVVYNKSRPLLGPDAVTKRERIAQYFNNRRDLYEPYLGAMQRLRAAGCSTIGLWVDGDSAEYPVWVLTGHEGGRTRVEIGHVFVKNESASLRTHDGRPFDPCAILLIAAHPAIPTTLPRGGDVYTLALQKPPVNLFLRDEPR